MTLDEFIPVGRNIKFAYKRHELLNEKEEWELWVRIMGDLDIRQVREAVDKWIYENPYPPTIADIRHMCNEKVQGELKYKHEMREIFEYTRGLYPGFCKMETDTMKYWNALTAADSWEERVEKAKHVSSEISEYVRMHELNGMVNQIPSFTERLEKMANELHS